MVDGCHQVIGLQTTELVARNHAEDLNDDNYVGGVCCFCGEEEVGVPVEDAVSSEYFNNGDLIEEETGHVCRFCAYCMNTRELKTGHWLATQDQYRSFSTGDIFQVLNEVAEGGYREPFAVHISDNPIKAQHSYLWCPVMEDNSSLVVSYGDQVVRFDWSEFEQLVGDIETLRGSGFRVKDIKSGEPRVRDLEDLGVEEYRRIEENLEDFRGSSLFELALTASSRP